MKQKGGPYSDRELAYFSVLANEIIQRFHPSLVLDAGCSWGAWVYVFHSLGVAAYGIDISEESLSQAAPGVREFLSEVDIDLQELPFPNEYFDLVVSHNSLEHFQNSEHFISEVRRILKPGGIIFVKVPTPPFETPEWLKHLLRLLRIQARQSLHPSTHSKASWLRLFKANGFEKVGEFPQLMKETCIAGEPLHWWPALMLLKFGPVGRLLWRQLAVILKSCFALEKAPLPKYKTKDKVQ